MKADKLRKLIVKYLNHPQSLSQNEVARRSGLAPSTLAQFVNGKEHKITFEQEYKIIDIVAPRLHDPDILAGKLKSILLRQSLPEHKIRETVLKLAHPYIASPQNL